MLCAISCSTDLNGLYVNDFLNIDYIFYFKKQGIDLLMVSNATVEVGKFLHKTKIDGIVLSGGNDIGECALRDTQERRLLAFAIGRKMPVLGICRGMQFINDYFGGKTKPVKNHVGVEHQVKVVSQAWVCKLKMRNLKTNSFHRYGVSTIGDDLEVACISEDGVVEALRHKRLPIAGIQWHPERKGNDKNKISTLVLRGRL